MKLAGVLEVGVLTVILLGLMARASQKRPEIDVRERAAEQSDATGSPRVA